MPTIKKNQNLSTKDELLQQSKRGLINRLENFIYKKNTDEKIVIENQLKQKLIFFTEKSKIIFKKGDKSFIIKNNFNKNLKNVFDKITNEYKKKSHFNVKSSLKTLELITKNDITFKAFSSHGTVDPIIPVDWARNTIKKHIKKDCEDLIFNEYNVGHTLSENNLIDFLNWINKTSFN